MGGTGLAGAFDVFFSYASRDHAVVEQVARDLTRLGIRIFLDRWYLTPGQPWPQALERTLDACKAVAVFIGAAGLGPWQQRERDLALDRQAREPGFPVIPVLLTPADPALGFLKLNTWVDLSASVTDPEALAMLAAAIRGEPPGPLARQQSEAALASVCPYRGLQPFREEDEPFFFGRTSFAETLTATVLRHPFVAVVGASGSGKSSVVRAGLIPRLRRGAGDLVWDAVTSVPTDRPLIRLAAALIPLLEPTLSEVDRLPEVNKLARHLGEGGVALREVAARVLAKQPGTDRLLLFVDQWEEVYTLCGDASVCQLFIGQLLDAAASDAVRVVLTIRGDFMGRVLENRDLSDRLQGGLVTIGPMTRDELADTIVQPAVKTGLRFDKGLPEMILDDVGDEPGGLPLLEFLLEGLWRARRGSVLTLDAYTKLGRVGGAIAHRAEEVFERSLDEAERQTAQRLLMRMVRPGEGVEDTRRRAALTSTDAVAVATIQKLASERLVITDCDGGSGQVTVEIAHEALIRRWQRLRRWIDADREFLRTRERIAAQARLWQNEARPPDRLLPPGRPLAEGEDVLATRRADLDPDLIDYIEASAAAGRAKYDAERAAERRRTSRARKMAAALAILLLLALAGGGFALIARDQARQSAAEAERNRAEAQKRFEEAQRNQSRALAALADNEVRSGSIPSAVRLALAGLTAGGQPSTRPYVFEAERALFNATQLMDESGWQEVQRFVDVGVLDASISAEGSVAIASNNNSVYIWDKDNKEQILNGHDGPVLHVGFDVDGKKMITCSSDGTRIWDVLSGNQEMILPGDEDETWFCGFVGNSGTAVTSSDGSNGTSIWSTVSGKKLSSLSGNPLLGISQDGSLIATSPDDKFAINIWNTVHSHQINSLALKIASNSVAFSADNRFLVAAVEKAARIWDISAKKQTNILAGHDAEVSTVDFSPDGSVVLTGSDDATVRLWDVKSGKQVVTLRGMKAPVLAAMFSADGRTIMTASEDNTVRLWRKSPEKLSVIGHTEPINSLAVGSANLSMTSSADRTVRLWDADLAHTISTLTGQFTTCCVAASPKEPLFAFGAYKAIVLWRVGSTAVSAQLYVEDSPESISFSPDGNYLATTVGKQVQVWDIHEQRRVAEMSGHDEIVWSAVFSPDGKEVASGSSDMTVRLWDATTGEERVKLSGHYNAVREVAFMPNGSLVTLSDEGVRIWDVLDRKQKEMISAPGNASYDAVAVSPDGSTIAVGMQSPAAIKLFDTHTLRELWEWRLDRAYGGDLAFSRDGRRLVAASHSTVVAIPIRRGEDLIQYACARVYHLPLSQEKNRAGIGDEWCTPETSEAMRAKIGMHSALADPPSSSVP